MAKKTETVATHLTAEQRDQLERIANLEGFDTTSEFLRHLAEAKIEEKRRHLETLMGVFGVDQNSVSSGSSQRNFSQFMRVVGMDVDQTHH